MKKLIVLVLLLCPLLMTSCYEKYHGSGQKLSYDRMYELLEEIQQTLDDAVIGEADGMWSQSSYDDLEAAASELRRGIVKAEAGLFILQFEVDNYVNSAEKALKVFKESQILAVEAGKPVELYVNGVDHKGYIDFGSSADYDPVNFTVEVWTKYNEGFIEFVFGSLISTFVSPIPYKGWSLHYWGVSNSLIRFCVGTDNPSSDNTLPTLYTPAPSTYGEWVHFAGVYDTGGQCMYLYVNGELKQSWTLSDKMVAGETADELRMWAFVEPLDHSRCVSGYIKKFRLWSVAKTQEEVNALMNSDVTGSEPGLACAWDFTIKPENDSEIPDKTGHHTAKLVGSYKWFEIK